MIVSLFVKSIFNILNYLHIELENNLKHTHFYIYDASKNNKQKLQCGVSALSTICWKYPGKGETHYCEAQFESILGWIHCKEDYIGEMVEKFCNLFQIKYFTIHAIFSVLPFIVENLDFCVPALYFFYIYLTFLYLTHSLYWR